VSVFIEVTDPTHSRASSLPQGAGAKRSIAKHQDIGETWLDFFIAN
jgi:hypothetical protein